MTHSAIGLTPASSKTAINSSAIIISSPLVMGVSLQAIDFQIINFTRPEGGRRISYTSTTDNTVKLFI